MAIFVHLTPEENVETILRTGITRFRRQDDHPVGIFAKPGEIHRINHLAQVFPLARSRGAQKKPVLASERQKTAAWRKARNAAGSTA